MNVSTLMAEKPPVAPYARIDRRQYRRAKLQLLSRYMRKDKNEYPCLLTEVSVGGAEIVCSEMPQPGEHIVVYNEQIGGLDCTVIQSTENGCYVRFDISNRRKQKLAAQLIWLLNHNILDSNEQRREGHDRINLGRTPIKVVLADGETIQCAAIDVSVSGAGLVSDVRPELNSEIKVGNLNARVVRHTERGFGVAFLHKQELQTVRRNFA